ncbi:MAG: hypothetical protein U0821_07265 [Chloroflexota bacterium]
MNCRVTSSTPNIRPLAWCLRAAERYALAATLLLTILAQPISFAQAEADSSLEPSDERPISIGTFFDEPDVPIVVQGLWETIDDRDLTITLYSLISHFASRHGITPSLDHPGVAYEDHGGPDRFVRLTRAGDDQSWIEGRVLHVPADRSAVDALAARFEAGRPQYALPAESPHFSTLEPMHAVALRDLPRGQRVESHPRNQILSFNLTIELLGGWPRALWLDPGQFREQEMFQAPVRVRLNGELVGTIPSRPRGQLDAVRIDTRQLDTDNLLELEPVTVTGSGFCDADVCQHSLIRPDTYLRWHDYGPGRGEIREVPAMLRSAPSLVLQDSGLDTVLAAAALIGGINRHTMRWVPPRLHLRCCVPAESHEPFTLLVGPGALESMRTAAVVPGLPWTLTDRRLGRGPVRFGPEDAYALMSYETGPRARLAVQASPLAVATLPMALDALFADEMWPFVAGDIALWRPGGWQTVHTELPGFQINVAPRANNAWHMSNVRIATFLYGSALIVYLWYRAYLNLGRQMDQARSSLTGASGDSSAA